MMCPTVSPRSVVIPNDHPHPRPHQRRIAIRRRRREVYPMILEALLLFFTACAVFFALRTLQNWVVK